MTGRDGERESIERGARGLGVELGTEQVDALIAYLDTLDLWRARMNLVSARDRREIIDRHLLDSLAVAPLLLPWLTENMKPNARVVDIGSGAGLPGIPLAIAIPQARFALLEPRAKRVSFLQSAVRSCFTWNIEVVCSDVAGLADSDSARFHAAVSRATFPPNELPSQALALLEPGGHLFALTGETFRPETLEEGYADPPVLHAYRRPGDGRTSQIVHWRKASEKTYPPDSPDKSNE